MVAYSCNECRFRFEVATKATTCPRCGSASVAVYENRGAVGSDSLKSGKEGWRDFHNQQQKTCPRCNGTEFDLNYKRKEKVCKKCGEVLALPRRFA